MSINWSRSKFLLAAVALLCAALAMPATGWAKTVLNRGTGSDPDTLDPHVSSGNTAAILIYDFFLPLMTLDAKGDVTYGAAESYTMSADGLIYTFKLRPNLKWSDGKAMTAVDFVYAMRRVQNPETTSRYAQWFWAIKNAQKVSMMPVVELRRLIDPLLIALRHPAESPPYLRTVAPNQA